MPLDGSSQDIGSILFAAADLIERDGWCQGVFEIDEKRCVVASIREAAGGPYASATERLRRRVGVASLTGWNDDPSRTKDQVIAALRDAARG